MSAMGGQMQHRKRAALVRLYGHFCVKCRRSDVKLTLDHIVPHAQGGRHDLGNLQLMCRPCNQTKSNTEAVDYRPFRPEVKR